MPLFGLQTKVLLLQRCYIRCYSKNILFGKPDKVSNIRPVFVKTHENDTALERQLKELQEKAQQWHHNFWAQHNERYSKGRDEFVQKHVKGKNVEINAVNKIEPEEMAVFHRQFLQDNFHLHQKYDGEWKKLNRQLILLMAQVNVQRLVLKLFKPFRKKKS